MNSPSFTHTLVSSHDTDLFHLFPCYTSVLRLLLSPSSSQPESRINDINDIQVTHLLKTVKEFWVKMKPPFTVMNFSCVHSKLSIKNIDMNLLFDTYLQPIYIFGWIWTSKFCMLNIMHNFLSSKIFVLIEQTQFWVEFWYKVKYFR